MDDVDDKGQVSDVTLESNKAKRPRRTVIQAPQTPTQEKCPESVPQLCRVWQLCLKGSANECGAMGSLHYVGKRVKKDYKKSAYYFEKACKLKLAGACYNLGQMYRWNKGGIPKDVDKSNMYYGKACQLKEDDACYILAEYANRSSTKSYNFKKAIPWIAEACQRGKKITVCSTLGLLYEKGKWVTKNEKKAYALFAKACRKNNVMGCSRQGFYMAQGMGGTRLDYPKARQLLHKACNLKSGAACHNLGVMYLRGYGVPKSPKTAKTYFQKGCKTGNQSSCTAAQQ